MNFYLKIIHGFKYVGNKLGLKEILVECSSIGNSKLILTMKIKTP